MYPPWENVGQGPHHETAIRCPGVRHDNAALTIKNHPAVGNQVEINNPGCVFFSTSHPAEFMFNIVQNLH
ncbi:hypothetical protein ABI_36750 [Asticcacaulis biprosthecium C19]|uniref:Uncharacterized protein n=1 Tax=Asticcacaulis biprosthecium C19 TaxID=715226 RepID=F4QR07_9CAUL|nr:hypothetical protein ABI_36750 [Asticcacaulis biprosthecium C19]